MFIESKLSYFTDSLAYRKLSSLQSSFTRRFSMTNLKVFVGFAIFLVFSVNFASSEIRVEENSIKGSEVIHKIIENVFATKTSNIRIVYTDKLDNIKFEGFYTVEIIEASKIDSFSLKKSRANIFQLNTFRDFDTIFKNLSSEKFNFGGYFLLVVRKCSSFDADKVFKAVWRRYIYNLNILCEANDTVSIKTFLPFQSSSCGNTTSITLDIESVHAFYPEKLKNLFECPIKLATFFYPPITMRETLENGSYRYYGSEMELLFGLAEALNFSVDMTYIAQSGFTGLLYENGTATGILKQTIEGQQDMLMGFYYLTYLRTQYLSFTQSHYSIPLIIMIPPGETYSAFEKLFQPFDKFVWICILFTLGIAVVTIFIVGRLSLRIKNFVFGEGVRNHYLNMVIGLVGGSQQVLPRKSFPRTLLMIFLLFCLVWRSVYQGSLFLFLQSDGRKPPVSTIDEMIEKSFVFYVRDTLEHNIRHMHFYNQ